MASARSAKSMINTDPTQLRPDPARARQLAAQVARSAAMAGRGADAAEGAGRVALEVGFGIVVYPPEGEGVPWRAVFTENGRRRFRQAMTEAGLAARLEKVIERLASDAPNLERTGADLIAHYLDPDRHPAGRPWSRRHADTQRRLCHRFITPVIATVTCQDITVSHAQQIVNAAPTPGEGDRVGRCLSALVTAGIKGGYLTSSRLREVHWQAHGRPVPALQPAAGGESALWVDPAEIPAPADIAELGRALAAGRRSDLDELMASTAAYTGLRQVLAQSKSSCSLPIVGCAADAHGFAAQR